LVSVIVLCQHRLSLGKALDSVQGQTHGDLEIIVVQDGCPKSDKALCKSANCNLWTCQSVEILVRKRMESDGRIKYLQAPQCAGYGSGYLRNFAIANSSGEYIAYLDDDNWWESNHVSSLLGVLYPMHSFAWSGSFLWRDGVKVGHRLNSVPCRNGIDTSEIMHYRNLINEVGGWPDHPHHHDWNLIHRFMKIGKHGFHLPECTVNYTMHEPSAKYKLKKKILTMAGFDLSPGEVLFEN